MLVFIHSFIIYYASKAAHHIYTVKKTHANTQHKLLQLKWAYIKKAYTKIHIIK